MIVESLVSRILMVILECPSCQRSTGFKRALGVGTLFMVLITSSKALYRAARDCSKGLLAGIALPYNAHLKCVEKISPALRALGIGVFFVFADGRVDIQKVWECLRVTRCEDSEQQIISNETERP